MIILTKWTNHFFAFMMPCHQYATYGSAAVGAWSHTEWPNQPNEVVKSSQDVSSKSLFCQNGKLKFFDIMMA